MLNYLRILIKNILIIFRSQLFYNRFIISFFMMYLHHKMNALPLNGASNSFSLNNFFFKTPAKESSEF